MKTYVGIDIGKSAIYYAYPLEDGGMLEGHFKNTGEGIAAFIGQLPAQSHCVMESTGLYHFPLAYALEDAGMALSIINPFASRAFANSVLSITKTDSKDAVMLQRLGQERKPSPTQLCGKKWQAFRHRMVHWQYLIGQKGLIANKLSELAFHPCADEMTVSMLEEQQNLLNEQLDRLEASIYQQMPTDYEQQLQKAVTVKGIGKKTACYLLLFTNGLQGFESPKALAKYVGVAPNIHQSGGYKKKGHICKKGNGLIRSLLYNCARSAYRYNTACKQLYERLREKGKAHNVAMVAVMHKLLRQFFAVVKNNVPYQDGFGCQQTAKT